MYGIQEPSYALASNSLLFYAKIYSIEPLLYAWHFTSVKGRRIVLDPLRVSGWVWKLYWQKQINKRKKHHLFNISFTWHGNILKEIKTQRNRPEYIYARLDEQLAVVYKYDSLRRMK